MHFEHFSKDLMSIHVWRQTQTQSYINNFYEVDMNILNPRRNDLWLGNDGIYRMEFPLMQWLVACLYQVFGKHLIISRIFMFVCGLLTTLGIYHLLKALFNKEKLALIGAWTFTFSPCFYYYTINPLPDNFALGASIWGLALFYYWTKHKNTTSLVLSGFFFSIGALCKLPFIVYYIVPIVYFLNQIKSEGLNKSAIKNSLFHFSFSVLPVIWYAAVIPQWGDNMVIKGMMENEDSWLTIIDYLQHNLVSALPELLLNYGSVPFFIAGFYFLFKRKSYKDSNFNSILALSIMVLFYFFFEINAIAKVHDYYLFPFYPLLFILVAYGAYHLLKTKHQAIIYTSYFLLLVLPFTCYLRMHTRWDPTFPGFNPDLLIYKEELRNVIEEDDLVVVGNDDSFFIFLYYIDKKGWGFARNALTKNQLENMINSGAKYLYSDSRSFENRSDINPYLNKLVLEKGSIRVYTLNQNLPKQTD